MKKTLLQTLLLLAITAMLVACNKDDNNPDSGSGNGQIFTFPDNSVLILHYIFGDAEDGYYDIGIVSKDFTDENEGIPWGAVTVNGVSTSPIPEEIKDQNWLRNAPVTVSFAGKGDIPAFSVSNSRWPTVDFTYTLSQTTDIPLNSEITIIFDRNVTADFILVYTGEDEGSGNLARANGFFPNINGNSLTVPASIFTERVAEEGNSLDFFLIAGTIDEDGKAIVNGKTIYCINSFDPSPEFVITFASN